MFSSFTNYKDNKEKNNTNVNSNIIKKRLNNRYWAPIQNVYDILIKYCNNNNYKNILEIGPGYIQFPLATKFVGFNEKVKDFISVDIDEEPLPFKDKEFDFVYSRHTLEDIQNPNYCLKEIIRTSKSGYIETPSPLVEVTKGVDGHFNSDKYGGYIHHRYIIWSDMEKNEVYILPKYSCVIDNFLVLNESSYDILKNPYYWNNYFLWKEEPKVIMYKNGVNFQMNFENYTNLLKTSINTSIKNTDYFLKNYQ